MSLLYILLAFHFFTFQICFAIEDKDRTIPWNMLNITWGMENDTNAFKSMPRDMVSAVAAGFVPLHIPQFTPEYCGLGKFLGYRMWRNNDPVVILIFDKQGTIAGIQSGVLKEVADAIKDDYSFYPGKPSYQEETIKSNSAITISVTLSEKTSLTITIPAMETAKNIYVSTAYFIPLENICKNGGRTLQQLTKQGTGTELYFQNGSNPLTDFFKQELEQKNMNKTAWTLEKCYKSMGLHYYYNVTPGLPCKDFYNFFLIFNKQELTGFGFLHGGGKYQSPQFEHLPLAYVPLFLDPPDCIPAFYKKTGGITTMHVFFNAKPENRDC